MVAGVDSPEAVDLEAAEEDSADSAAVVLAEAEREAAGSKPGRLIG
jgi:hypothetical protein